MRMMAHGITGLERVKGQWVFGGVERGSGRAFFGPVSDRTTETLTAVIRAWMEPGSRIISDCWALYNCLEQQGYTYLTVNDSIDFINHDTRVHTNAIENC